LVGIFDTLSPWIEILLTILGFASAIYPVGRWAVKAFNKRQDKFEATIKEAIGADRKAITDVVESAKSDIKEVKDNQDRLHNDVVRVDEKVGNMDDRLDKHMLWTTGITNRMQTQIENNTRLIVKNDDRIDNVYTRLAVNPEPYTPFKKTEADKDEEEKVE
jgi:vacuolar-type H+-ATPase subunit I/STV1